MDEETWWYIDALDATAGSAFASHRTADLMDAEELSEPAYHLEAPYFRPEPIASRALAFAATRAGHQLGLFVAEQEVAFVSLDDLTEFVRRAYVASGGGDGGGGGPTPPTPPDDDGPPPGSPKFDSSQHVQRMLTFSARISDLQKTQSSVDASGPRQTWPIAHFEPYRWEPLEEQEGSQILSFAAGILLLEFLQRFPRTPDRLSDWEEGFWRLNSFHSHFNVHQDIRAAFSKPVVKVIGQNKRLQNWLSDRPYSHGPWFDQDYWAFNFSDRSLDVFDTLSLFPIPKWIADNKDISVRDYLAIYLASPQTLKKAEGAAIIIFASACIALQGKAVPRRSYSSYHECTNLSVAGLRWLDRQLPSKIYDGTLERLIEDACELRAEEYRGTADVS